MFIRRCLHCKYIYPGVISFQIHLSAFVYIVNTFNTPSSTLQQNFMVGVFIANVYIANTFLSGCLVCRLQRPLISSRPMRKQRDADRNCKEQRWWCWCWWWSWLWWLWCWLWWYKHKRKQKLQRATVMIVMLMLKLLMIMTITLMLMKTIFNQQRSAMMLNKNMQLSLIFSTFETQLGRDHPKTLTWNNHYYDDLMINW